MVPSVRKPIQPILSPPNPGASTIYTLTSKAIAPVVPIARDLHQCGSFMRTCGGSATPPCPTIPRFSFPGTSPPLVFYHITETRLTYVFVLRQLPAFTAGIVLLLNIWGAKRSGGVTEPAREMEDVHKCMAVLQAAEGRCDRNIPYGIFFSSRLIHFFRRWHAAGRLWCVNNIDFVSYFLVLTERQYTGMFFMS
jgi:hypothetical protein